jgi:hypothetical protein
LQSLPHESVLELLAEISAAFVGFSMLASVFRANTGDDRVRFAGFRDVAETALLAMLGSVTPLLLHALDWDAERIWRAASGALAALWAVGTVFSMRRNVRVGGLGDRARSRPLRIWFVHVVTGAVVVVGFASALFPSPGSGGRHVLLVALCLVQSANLFLFAGFEDIGVPVASGEEDDAE